MYTQNICLNSRYYIVSIIKINRGQEETFGADRCVYGIDFVGGFYSCCGEYLAPNGSCVH